MRNVTALSVLLPRLRDSLFDKEVLSEGIYPTNIFYRNGTLGLRYTFIQVPGRAAFRSYCMLMRGRDRHYVEISYSDGSEEPVSEPYFVNRILDGMMLDDMELLEEPYEMTEDELERAMDDLYRWYDNE